MGTFSEAAKNDMLDAITIDKLSLHSADPGVNGTANELSGGDPAYARKAAVYNAASGGERTLQADVVFDVPSGATVAYVVKWQSGSPDIYRGVDSVTNEVYAAQGTYTVKAGVSKLVITD